FMIGGLAWFAIPFTLATTLGLAAVAIGVPLTSEQIGMGLVAPTAASQVLGDFGAILLLTMLFTAVTAAGSAELISVSSLITYDVYRTYFNPSATGRGLMRISRLAIVSFGIGMGLLAVILLQVGASLQYVYLTMGVLIGSAVVPISLAIVWKRTNKVAATAGALVGLVCGVAVWLSFSYAFYGTVSVSTTSQSLPLLAGNVTSILVGGIVTLFGSMVRPDNFDFRLMKQKIKIVDAKIRRAIEQESDEEYLKRWSKFGYKFGIALTLTLVIAWPIPLYISGYVFSKDAYIVWVGIAVSWAATAATVIVLLPLVESRVGIVKVLNRISQASVVEQVTERNALYPAPDSEGEQQKRILVPVDGSHQSLRALDYAASIYNRGSSIHPDKVMIIILNVIEWVDEDDESMDEDLTAAMEEQGRRMLRSIIIPKSARDYERMVKLGDPATKIVEMAEKLKVDMIVMGATGLSNSEEIGHVSRKVLKMTTSIPVMFTK
ncbi:MAG: universal stress protein, partial [Thermoproteota archaeon]|nr:universal stress protein [Thermoproteota archaeon]